MVPRLIAGLLIAAGTVWLSLQIMERSGAMAAPMQGVAQQGNVALDPASESTLRDGTVRAALMRRLANSDTYLPAMLKESDSLLRRWTERMHDPLRVYFEPTTVAGFTTATERAARDAFARWARVAQIPVSFVYVRTEEESDVVVKWLERFPMERAGQAEVLWQSNGWLRQGTLTLATHTFNGHLLSSRAVFTVALHEIGHLLGLGHSDDPRDVMYPTTSVHDLTGRDRRTAMLLYSFPPGTLKE